MEEYNSRIKSTESTLKKDIENINQVLKKIDTIQIEVLKFF